ncbi:MAG TPA: hypothetical protein VIA81_11445 [Acidimicrobiia bacterium]|jgi:hypothetical protein
MNSLLFGLAQAREIEIRHQMNQPKVTTNGATVLDWIGRTLITWGEHLVFLPERDVGQEGRAA